MRAGFFALSLLAAGPAWATCAPACDEYADLWLLEGCTDGACTCACADEPPVAPLDGERCDAVQPATSAPATGQTGDTAEAVQCVFTTYVCVREGCRDYAPESAQGCRGCANVGPGGSLGAMVLPVMAMLVRRRRTV